MFDDFNEIETNICLRKIFSTSSDVGVGKESENLDDLVVDGFCVEHVGR